LTPRRGEEGGAGRNEKGSRGKKSNTEKRAFLFLLLLLPLSPLLAPSIEIHYARHDVE
jgi:hypothetical protein